LPEVNLVAILDADKEGFLRSERSLTQTAGRAARNVNSKVIMYAEKITGSMQRTIDETNRRRIKQLAYNEKHGITPRSITKSTIAILGQSAVLDKTRKDEKAYAENTAQTLAADPIYKYMSADDMRKAIAKSRKSMDEAVKELDFIAAARFRDEIAALQEMIKKIS
jgi:excinuclease ABC subunit B